MILRYALTALIPAAIVAALAAALPEPFAFEEPLIRTVGGGRNAVTLALAHALHYVGRYGTWIALALALFYLRRGEKRMALCLAATPALAALTSYLLKNTFDRVRPDILTHLVHQSDASFPSGHSTFAAALAAVFILRYPRAGVIAGGVALMLAMGWSRLLLGVHYPTDILAGWSVGTAAALLCCAAYPPQEIR